MLLESFAYLSFNFASAVGVIFVNKALFSHFSFSFTTALTSFHYVSNAVGLELLAACGVFSKRSSPLSGRLLLLAIVVGMAPALNNLSLLLNSLGFYQVVKLLVTPCIVVLERMLYGARMSTSRAAALLVVCIGVGVACVNDMSINIAGSLAAAAWVPAAAVYKVLWSRIAKEEAWATLPLMQRVLPLSTCATLLMVPLIDPPGLFEFQWTFDRMLLVALSGVSAFFVNWSGFLVMGACSALTHTVLGQLKACVIILGGWLLFDQRYPPKSIFGASMAIIAMVAYVRANLQESRQELANGSSTTSGDNVCGCRSRLKYSPPVSPLQEHYDAEQLLLVSEAQSQVRAEHGSSP
mmetsp:Transcript_62262/g.103480  ORF Transcript_62262/g.103480 Transcript_62262/m.103480 type:complete len:352 (-) Transcript_62262:179-1234(-)